VHHWRPVLLINTRSRSSHCLTQLSLATASAMLTSLLSLTVLGLTLASPITPSIELDSRQTSCAAYTIIDTRGTGEAQGPSSGFITMNRNILAAKAGGKVYSTVYAADFSQQSAAGTADILRELSAELAENPARCFILEGYSQGAAATVRALEQLPTSDPRYAAVKGVFVIGNPDHKAGLACNVDTNGGTSTKFVNGISARYEGPIPTAWVGTHRTPVRSAKALRLSSRD
jgi:pimeloyl-ACP methyl ester carboxylesterase